MNPSIILLFLGALWEEILPFLVLPESDLGFLAFLVAGSGGSSFVGCSLTSEAVSAKVTGSTMGEAVLDSMEASPSLGDESTPSSGSGFSILLGSSPGQDQTVRTGASGCSWSPKIGLHKGKPIWQGDTQQSSDHASECVCSHIGYPLLEERCLFKQFQALK